jgi:ABC-type branched-subunit amino acid transport system ATPase component
MSELRVEGLAKSFGGLRVFENISFALPAGEILGVIGPNGAGKTTLINVISGRLAPSEGRVLLDGRDVTGWPTHALSKLGVARSFQQTNTFRSVSVRENLARAIRFGHGTEGDLARLLRDFGLGDRLEEQSDKLPYGLQKMLGLLMAFATGPRVVLLDEPAAGLERAERHRIDAFVQHACVAAGCAVLIVEHDMDLIRRLCPRVLVLDAGAVLADGATAEVLARPDVIAAYLGVTDDEAA